MAQTIALTVVDQWSDGKRLHVHGTCKVTGTYATPGPTLVFTGVQSSDFPEIVFLQGRATGLHGTYIKGATVPVGTVRFWGGATEHAEDVFSAGELADTFDFYAIFKALI